MAILSDQSLEFARQHIEKYYDSDFFPKPDEFEALWYNWGEVKDELASKNIRKFSVFTPRIFPAAKPSGDFRAVHQLEPENAIAYTAMAYEVAEEIEKTRPPKAEKVACSYRIDLGDGQFFDSGSGYGDFIAQTENLGGRYDYILSTDIVDFYNQIYLHRVNHAIEFANSNFKDLSDDIESFLMALNQRCSQGVPVGPAASIIISEAVLMDVDDFLANEGFVHTRYVDDFRIFSNSPSDLRRVQESLTMYMYENHRLTLSGPKTSLMDAETFIQNQLHNPYAEEKRKFLESIQGFNPYTTEIEEVDIDIDDDEWLAERVSEIIKRVLEYDYLDLGLARSALRNARNKGIVTIVPDIIDNFLVFSPVISDVVLYLLDITDDEFIQKWRGDFVDIVEDHKYRGRLSRFWLEWYLASYREFVDEPKIRDFLYSSPHFVNAARAAMARKDVAWIRNEKAKIQGLGNWERRALMNAAAVLPTGEKRHWLTGVENNSVTAMDRWMAKWVRDAT